MKKPYKTGLFVFRRDLRLVDNKGLHSMHQLCENIIPVFIFTPEQVGKKNDYKSKRAVKFMLETLMELSHDIKQQGGSLHTFYGENNKIIRHCIEEMGIDVVCFNQDITPYAIERDKKIMTLCKSLSVACLTYQDYYLYDEGKIVTGSNTPYMKFTPYYEKAVKIHVDEPHGSERLPFIVSKKLEFHITLENAFVSFVGKVDKEEKDILKGGRRAGWSRLLHASQSQKQYSKFHNVLSHPTTQLSPYIKFGCISIREAYYKLKHSKDLIRQLIWREFYANILYHYPHVLGKAMKPNYNKIHWKKNAKYLESWKRGDTGFPVVDAGMRQLNATGYMHNRARLIVASFLVKTLLIDWREGEQYFATHLVDYDPASNNGNWQWIAGSGADSQPYFRIFNPWQQSANYDPQGEYIKQWVPELEPVDPRDLHRWNERWDNDKYKDVKYPEPIVDYSKQKELVLDMYSRAFH